MCALCLPGIPYGTALLPRLKVVDSVFFLRGACLGTLAKPTLKEFHPEGIVFTQPLQGGENIMGPSLSAWLGDLGTQFCL